MRRSLRIAPGKAAALFIDLQEEHRQDKRYLVAGFEAIIANVRDLQRQRGPRRSRSSTPPMSSIPRTASCDPSIP